MFSNQQQENTVAYNMPFNVAGILSNSPQQPSSTWPVGSYKFNNMYQQSNLRSWGTMFPVSNVSVHRLPNTSNISEIKGKN